VTVEGALLQLQAADGSIVTFAPGSTFRLTGEGESISLELISGSMRVASSGMPISVSRDGVTVATVGGTFSAFEGVNGLLEGRVNAGTATLTNLGGTREFAKGDGYILNANRLQRRFDAPAAPTPGFLLASFESEGADYSPADDQGPDGAQIVDGAPGGGGGGSGGGGGGSSQTEVGDVKTDWQVAFGGGSVDVRHESEVYIDGDDTVNSWRWTAANGSWGRGTKPAEDTGGVADVIAWSRWGTGTPDIYSNVNSEWEEFGAAGSIAAHYHVVVGAPATNLPGVGTADYNLIGSTVPTMTDDPSQTGVLNAAAMRVDFAALRVGLTLDVSQGGNDWYLETPGGLAATAASGMSLVAQGSVGFVPPDFFYGNNGGAAGFAVEASLNGSPCGACVSDVRGFIAGDEASHAGLTYRFAPAFGDPSLVGAAAFAKAP